MGILLKQFYIARITLISKPDKDITRKKKLQTNICYKHRCKNPQQWIRYRIKSYIKRTIQNDEVGFIPGM